MAVELPSELMVEILSWLPSKSLLRCRSVCKSWLSLISSTQFRLMHLHNFNQLNSRYVVRRRFIQKEEFPVHFDDQNFTLDSNAPIKFPYNLNLSGTGLLSFEIIGCCNGVLCFSINTIGRDEIILWNPSIRRKLTLIPPMYHRSELPDLDLLFGFGYHITSDDYKVVRLSYDRHHELITTFYVQIYTVKNAIWREVIFPNDLPSGILSKYSVFVNGYVHWLAVVGDSLAIIRHYMTVSSSSYEIWVMEDKNNQITLAMSMIYKVEYTLNNAGRALGLTNNGYLIMVGCTEGDVKICNQEGGFSVYGSCRERIDSKYTFVERYQESLALLDHGELDDDA
ncbi:hypothetical protein L2E82_29809 [Cichorium intybus]|uniref:Uncharacterized protein n=1 Tax=Cichorium intybus TaxID=13427 RepID=A0ACB9CYS3_CICIN|nr:hypothetical protein L2E82_29809 [Cichorium intybus]